MIQIRQGILSNSWNLVSLADITASNFKFLHKKCEGLRNITFEYFQSYTSSLIATKGETIFNRNYILYYVNTTDKANTDLSFYRNELQTAKSFISRLHILVENKMYFLTS